MLLGARTTKLPWFHVRRPLRTVSKRFSINLRFSSASESKVFCSLDDECDDFLPWLERLAGIEISRVLSIGKSQYGRALFASKLIQAGDCVLKVPYNVQITPDDLPPTIKNSLTDDIGNIGRLATVILLEKKKGRNSRWVPYISRLPRLADIHSTIFWSVDELNMIQCSHVHAETAYQKSQIEKEFSVVSHALKQHIPESLGSTTLKDFMHAYALVGSRAWGTSKGLSLIPFADFLNHDGVSESIVLSDEEERLSEVIADRDYVLGEEVLIRYGRFSNATLSLDFGFTLPYNIHDQIQIRMSVPPHDPLCKKKSELLQTHQTRSVMREAGFCQSSWDSFTIKEVNSAKGNGKGIPQSLRAFARVLCCTSAQELEELTAEAARSDGRLARLPLKESSKEIQAHQLLFAHFTGLIEEHHTCIKRLESFAPRSEPDNLVIRIRMAQDLLVGELRVLESAAAWLSNYCTSLLTTAPHH